MARGRFITATLGASHKLASVTDDAHRLMFVLMVANADVEGRLDADPRILNGRVFTLMGWSLDTVEAGLQALADADLIRWYQVDGRPFAEIVKFHEHNSVRKDREQASHIKGASEGKPMRRKGDAGALPEYSRSTPAQEKLSEVQVKTKSSTREELSSTSSTRERHTLAIQVWNDHRGNLPAVTAINKKRKTAIDAFAKEHGDDALDLLRDATCAVAADDFWNERGYGFDNLVPSKVLRYAEKWRAGHAQLGTANTRMATQVHRWAQALDALDERPVN